ncbi:MAG: hypothetical protein R3F39_06140 [Myxococcota bacterium]
MHRLLVPSFCFALTCLIASPVLATSTPTPDSPARWTLRNEATTLQSALYRGQTAITVRAELRVSAAAVAAAREGRPVEQPKVAPHIATPEASYRSAGASYGSPTLFDEDELSWINALTQADAERAGTAPGVAVAAAAPEVEEVGVTTRLQVEVTGLPVVSSPDAPVRIGATEPVNLQVVPDALPGAGSATYSGISTVTITPDVARACAATPKGQTCTIGYTLRITRLGEATDSLVGLRVEARSEMGGAGLRAPKGARIQLAVAR